MKLKITRNVVVGTKLAKAGDVVDVDEPTGKALLARKCAEAHKPEPPPPPPK